MWSLETSPEHSWNQRNCVDKGVNFSFVSHLVHPQQLLEIRLPLYWLNDSPKRWFLEVSTFLRDIGWTSAALDECVFMFYDPDSKALAGILCLHVNDLLLGGTAHRQTVDALRSRCPFRKRKRNQGEFCGSHISRDVLTKVITVSQSTFALTINKVTVRARAQPEDKATAAEVRSLRGCDGAVQWLARSCSAGEYVTASSQ